MRIKCYDHNGKLYTSRHVTYNSEEFYRTLYEAQCIIHSDCIYIKEKNTSIRINHKQQKATVQSPYTGSDGISTWTIPIRKSAYPLIKNAN